MKKQTSYLLTTTPQQQAVGIARRITPYYRFRRRLPCEKIRQKSTGKELDRETGLYYFGARYLDPRTSRWLSVDPAIWQGDFLPSAPNSDAARRRNQNLPGQGGVFNTINLHVFNYGNNNPVRYVDPDGRFDIPYFTRDAHSNYIRGILQAPFHGIAAVVLDGLAQVGNFFSNLGSANVAFYAESTLNIQGTPLQGTFSFSTDNGLQFSTSVDNLANFSEAIQGMVGSPITINSNGIDVSVGITTVGITRNGDNATVSFGVASPDQIRGIDLSIGMRVTACTQSGPFGTIQNRDGAAGRHFHRAEYLFGPRHFINSFFP